MKRLLITGASGFLGWNVCRAARQEWEVFGTVHSHLVEIGAVRIHRLDLTSSGKVYEFFDRIKPHAVIHTAAAASPNFCQTNPLESSKINVEASLHIARLSARFGIPCLFTSTDLIFDGLKPPYTENAPPSPVNVYGQQKVQAEQGMLREHKDTTICRMPLMFGEPGPAASSFIQPMLRAMKGGEELSLFTDEFRTPVSGGDAAHGLLLVLQAKLGGIIHLGGPERISRYAFGELLAKVFGFGGARLIPCLQRDVSTVAPRPRDVSLDSSKAFEIGFSPLCLEKALRVMVQRLR